jgi:hypothetical protein
MSKENEHTAHAALSRAARNKYLNELDARRDAGESDTGNYPKLCTVADTCETYDGLPAFLRKQAT